MRQRSKHTHSHQRNISAYIINKAQHYTGPGIHPNTTRKAKQEQSRAEVGQQPANVTLTDLIKEPRQAGPSSVILSPLWTSGSSGDVHWPLVSDPVSLTVCVFLSASLYMYVLACQSVCMQPMCKDRYALQLYMNVQAYYCLVLMTIPDVAKDNQDFFLQSHVIRLISTHLSQHDMVTDAQRPTGPTQRTMKELHWKRLLMRRSCRTVSKGLSDLYGYPSPSTLDSPKVNQESPTKYFTSPSPEPVFPANGTNTFGTWRLSSNYILPPPRATPFHNPPHNYLRFRRSALNPICLLD